MNCVNTIVGQKIDPVLAEHLEKELGMGGLVVVDSDTHQVNGNSKVFTGGDLIRGAGTAAEAVGDGRRAARAIDRMMKSI